MGDLGEHRVLLFFILGKRMGFPVPEDPVHKRDRVGGAGDSSSCTDSVDQLLMHSNCTGSLRRSER